MKLSSPAILCLGEPGNGKTYAVATLLKHPQVEKLFYLFTDPGGDESLVDALQHYEVPIDNVHWHYVSPASQGWDTMQELVSKINMMNYESLAGLKAGIDKSGHRQFFELIEVLANFSCDRTGESFGASDEWPDTYAVVFDSLTGLNKLARDTTVGAKPVMHQGEWGTAMELERNFITKFVSGIKGPRVMIGHLSKTMDEMQGRMTMQVSLLGNKLAPDIPHLFSDVVYAYREGKDFYWRTFDDRIALKSRNLPVSEKLPPDYRPLLDRWLQRKEYSANVEVKKEEAAKADT